MIRPNQLFIFFSGFVLSFIGVTKTFAQTNSKASYSQQLQLIVDNDAYFFTDYDRYYSSGIFATYSMATAKPLLKQWVTDFSKASYDFRFSHYMYTAKNILWKSLDQLDRPYAGMANLGVQLNYFYPKSAFFVGIDLGWLGPAIKTAELQSWWHERLNIRLPRGWEHQISNTPVLIFQPEYYRQLAGSEKLDVVSRSGFAAGTVFNKVFQEAIIRFGRPRPMDQTQLTNSLIGKGANNHNKYIEWYLFAALQGTYVLHNTTIDGNFIGPASAYTEESAPFVWQQSYGFALAGKVADFELAFKLNSQEVAGAEQHRYMRVKVSYRF